MSARTFTAIKRSGGGEIISVPQASEFLRDDTLASGFRGLQAQRSGMVLAQFALHLLQHTGFELRTAQTPATAEWRQRFLVGFLQTPSLHPHLKLLSRQRCVLLDAVLAQQPVHSQPGWAVLPSSQIQAEAAPRKGQQSILRLEQTGAHGVEMDVIAGALEIAGAAAIDQKRFVSAAEHMAKEFVPMI